MAGCYPGKGSFRTAKVGTFPIKGGVCAAGGSCIPPAPEAGVLGTEEVQIWAGRNDGVRTETSG